MNGYKEACGCRHDGYQWLKKCPPHEKEDQEFRARVMEEHRTGQSLYTGPVVEQDYA